MIPTFYRNSLFHRCFGAIFSKYVLHLKWKFYAECLQMIHCIQNKFIQLQYIGSNSPNTSRTSSDFQTPRRVVNTRRSRVFFNEFRSVLKSEEILITSVWKYFSNDPVFCQKIKGNAGPNLCNFFFRFSKLPRYWFSLYLIHEFLSLRNI